MNFTFKCDENLIKISERLKEIYAFEINDSGIPVYAVCGDKVGATYKDGVATIYYKQKHHFFRELGVLIQNLKNNMEFEIFEDSHFKTMGVMIDTSRCGVPRVSAINKMIDYLAAMGYNMVMLYTEDTVELKNYPYFGICVADTQRKNLKVLMIMRLNTGLK